MKDKHDFLKVYKKSRGNISEACQAANISRMTFYRWRDEDKEFAETVIEIDESKIDYVENKLFENIEGNKTNEILFYLKTKGKNRGYVERQEHQIDGGFPSKIQIEIIDPSEDTNE
jgi:hypothetical protein